MQLLIHYSFYEKKKISKMFNFSLQAAFFKENFCCSAFSLVMPLPLQVDLHFDEVGQKHQLLS